MPIPLDVLYLATGFTGALTLIWLCRLVRSRWVPPLSLTAHFSPEGGCGDVVVREIAAARREVLLLAATCTLRPIAQALVDAKLRGVNVEVILEGSQAHAAESQLPFLVEQGLLPQLDSDHDCTRNHVVVIDGKTVVTGCFAFTTEAETSQVANLVVLREHAELASAYHAEFHKHKAHAKPVAGQPAAASEPEESEETETVSREAPVVTPAAAELFARLRKELAEDGEEKKAG